MNTTTTASIFKICEDVNKLYKSMLRTEVEHAKYYINSVKYLCGLTGARLVSYEQYRQIKTNEFIQNIQNIKTEIDKLNNLELAQANKVSRNDLDDLYKNYLYLKRVDYDYYFNLEHTNLGLFNSYSDIHYAKMRVIGYKLCQDDKKIKPYGDTLTTYDNIELYHVQIGRAHV